VNRVPPVPRGFSPVPAALPGTACGLFAGAFARTGFQAVQFMPAFALPQAPLCGLAAARDHMTPVLRWLPDILPLPYPVDAVQRITAAAAARTSAISADVAIILAFTAAAVVGGALTLRRRTS